MNAALNLNSVSMPVRVVVAVALVAGTAAMLMPSPASKPSAPIARAVRRSAPATAPAAEAVGGARSLRDGKDAAPSLTASTRNESPAPKSAPEPAAAPARDFAAGPAAVPAEPVASRTSQVGPGSAERTSPDGGSSRLPADAAPAPAAARLASAVLESDRQSLAVGAPIRELFRSPLVSTKAPKAAVPPLKAPPLPPANLASRVAAAPTPAAPPAPVGVQASSLEMLGVVEFDGKPQVLIRNKDNGQRKYYTAGDSAFGFVVKEIKENEVALERAGKTEMVSMSNAVALEGPGASTVAGASSGFGGGGFGGGRDRGGFGGRDRGAGGGGDRGSGGGRDSSSSGFSTASIMSLPTWKERLKKLEEVKAQVPADQYDRLHKFMTARVAAEAGK